MNDGPLPAPEPGIWRSVYTYESSSRGRTLTDEREILLNKLGGRLMAVSLSLDPDAFGRLRMDLNADGRLVTASWTERTDPDGYYGGAEFRGSRSSSSRLTAGRCPVHG